MRLERNMRYIRKAQDRGKADFGWLQSNIVSHLVDIMIPPTWDLVILG